MKLLFYDIYSIYLYQIKFMLLQPRTKYLTKTLELL